MPELRTDLVTGRMVLLAENRASRPRAFCATSDESQTESDTACPFCPGQEAETPDEVLAIGPADRRPNQPGWQVRVVPNKYPAVLPEGDPRFPGEDNAPVPAVGLHEVVIESPEHFCGLGQLPVGQVGLVMQACRDRMRQYQSDTRWRSGVLFKNSGRAAGASIEHTHSQLAALPYVPPVLEEELRGSLEQWHITGGCVFCEMISRSVLDSNQVGSPTVLVNSHFVALCPYASRFPYETWILPLEHQSHFDLLSDGHLPHFARIVAELLQALDIALDQPAYNYIMHSAPFDAPALPHYHWHLEVIPRLTQIAGFEWGAGCFINPVSPEQAARRLKEAIPARWGSHENILVKIPPGTIKRHV